MVPEPRGPCYNLIQTILSQGVPLGGLECVACESHLISYRELLLPPRGCNHVSGLTHTPVWKPEVTGQW